jgi:hypothetical protein
MNFQKIVPHELKPVTVTVQALDNQWVPGRLLKRMLDDNLGAEAVEKEQIPTPSRVTRAPSWRACCRF